MFLPKLISFLQQLPLVSLPNEYQLNETLIPYCSISGCSKNDQTLKRVHVGKPVGFTLVFEPLRTYIGTLELEQVFLCRSNRKVCANRRQPVHKHFGRKEELLSVQTNGTQQEFTVSSTNSTSEPRTYSRDVEFLLSGVTCIVQALNC